jgi:hypothetical protein
MDNLLRERQGFKLFFYDYNSLSALSFDRLFCEEMKEKIYL